MGRCSMYRCCVQLFIMIHLVPIIIHKSAGMCIIVAFQCCIDIHNCISKKNVYINKHCCILSPHQEVTKDLYEQNV